MRAPLRGLGLALILFLSSAEARAAGPTPEDLRAARDLFASAEKDEDGGKWSDALEKLRRVAEVRLTSGVRYHVALCEEHLGHLAQALDDYAQAEEQARADRAQDVLRLAGSRVAQLQDRVPHLTLSVPPDVPADTELRIDGKTVARPAWGTALPLDPGSHEVSARATGRVGFTTTIGMAERDHVVVEVKLPEAPPAATSPPPGPAASEAQPGTRTATEAPSPGSSRTLAIAATAGAVALLGVGMGAFLVAGSDHDDAKATCATRTSPCDDLRGPIRTWDAVALGAWVGAAAAGTLAVVFWLRPAREPSGASVGVVVGPASIGLSGDF